MADTSFPFPFDTRKVETQTFLGGVGFFFLSVHATSNERHFRETSGIVQLIALKDSGVNYNVAVGFLKNNLTFHERDIVPKCFNQFENHSRAVVF